MSSALLHPFRELLLFAVLLMIVLWHPNFDIPFEIHTDASMRGLGAVLCQIINGRERVVQYASRTVPPLTSKNSSANDLEAFAVVWAVETFRPYILGQRFIIRTDHSNLKQWLKTPEPGKSTRWVHKLSEYDFDIVHRPGNQNGNADGLSRNPQPNPTLYGPSTDELMINAITADIKTFRTSSLDVPLTIYHWNLNSVRSVLKKDTFFRFISTHSPSILCISELRCSIDNLTKMPDFLSRLATLGYHWRYWHPATGQTGYAGVAIISKHPPVKVTFGIGTPTIDCEGRVLTAEFDRFVLVTSYAPCLARHIATSCAATSMSRACSPTSRRYDHLLFGLVTST